MNDKRIHRLAFWAAFAGLIGVAFGAFGAHFLKSRIPPESLEVIRTGVLYLFVHVLATLVVVSICRQGNVSRLMVTAGTLFMTGVLLF
ncbi:MAG TPA: DUF423 domain-containing protein, partial [Saprospiraceae bacterium]|nr:DUF423 domain-containing protein [Saprospiraceae bacterium]